MTISEMLRAAYKKLLDEPVPEALKALLDKLN